MALSPARLTDSGIPSCTPCLPARATCYQRSPQSDKLDTDNLAGAHWAIDRKAHDPERKLVNGVVLGNGDGTVPLLSLGALCHKHWREKKLNPAGVKVRAARATATAGSPPQAAVAGVKFV